MFGPALDGTVSFNDQTLEPSVITIQQNTIGSVEEEPVQLKIIEDVDINSDEISYNAK